MHWKASIATVMAITHTYDSWSAYPMKADMGLRKSSTRAMNRSEVKPTLMSVVVYTFCGFSPSLLAKRKKVVSIP